jgi:hypothetical protein
MNGQQYMMLAYCIGLGLLVSYATGLWIAAGMARKSEQRSIATESLATSGAGGVL